VRAKLLNRDTVFREWNNNAFSDDEFPKTKKILLAQPLSYVEQDDGGSLT